MRIIENVKKHKVLVFILISLFAVCCGLVTTSSVAWFARSQMNTDDRLSGGAITNYFHVGLNGNQTDYVGDGDNNPFIITIPKHYYNLVNLYQKVSDYSDQHYHFQVGAKLKGENGGFWVYDVDEKGQMQKAENGYSGDVSLDGYKISKVLDMTCYGADEPLLPIGTHDKNFLGTFEGNGLTLSNFTIKWEGDDSTCDVGIFGYIGPGVNINKNYDVIEGVSYPIYDADEVTKIQNVYFKNVVIDVSNVSISNISDFSDIEDTVDNAKTKTHKASSHDIVDSEGTVLETVAYVGTLAGHVVTTVDIKNVFLDEITIKGGNQALSNFGYFGCIEDEKGNVARSIGEAIGIEYSSGTDVGWGGSLDMLSLFNRLQDVHNYTDYKSSQGDVNIPNSGQFSNEQTFLTKYVSNEIVVNINGNIYHGGLRDTAINFVTGGDGYTYTYYQSGDKLSGSYYFEPDTWSNGSNWYMALFGESSKNKKRITTYTAEMQGDSVRQYSAYLIRHGESGVYLTVNGNTLVGESQLMGSEITDFQMEQTNDSANVDLYNSLTLSISQKWILENGNLYAIVDGNLTSNSVKYYLNKNGNHGLSVSDTPLTSTWAYDEIGFYCTVNNVKYYLTYLNGYWALIDGVPMTLKTANGQNYLALANNNNNVSIVNSTNPNATIWFKQQNDNVYYTVVNGIDYYLYCNGELGVTATLQNATNWNVDVNNNFSMTYQGIEYGIVFSGNEWKVVCGGTVVKFDNTHYLVVADNGAISNSATKDGATLFQIDASNRLYVIRNGAIRYLTLNNGNLAFSNTTTNAFTLNGSNNFVATVSGINYYLTYDGGWKISSNRAYAITDGSNNYLQINGTNTFANTTTLANASPIISYPTGTTATSISTVINGVIYYFAVDTNHKLVLQTNPSAKWTFQSNRFIYDSTYYLVYDTTWQVVRAFTVAYTTTGIFATTNYMAPNSDTAITRSNTATVWYIDSDGYAYTYRNNANRYLNRNGATLTLGTTKTLTWSIDASNRLRSSDGYYVRYRNNSFSANTSTSNAATITKTTPNRYVSRSVAGSGSQAVEEWLTLIKASQDDVIPTLTSIETLTVQLDVINSKTSTTRYSFIKSFDNNNGAGYDGGYNNVIPLRLASEDEINGVDENGDPIAWYTEDDPFRVSVKNTGYIVGGAKIVDSSQSAAQREAGDIRISGFPISSVNTSYTRNNGGAFTNEIRTVGLLNTASNGTVTADDDNINLEGTDSDSVNRKNQLANYETTKEKLLEILKAGNTMVYGLHFMDAQISMNRKIVTEKALVSGKLYSNYELPQDCIDFTVNTQNYISFFAGSYYSGNKSFFSLHRIVRDEETGTIITAIKEIKAIYGHKTAKETNPYIYVYTDNTMEKGQKNNAGKTVYTSVASVPNDYQICFDMTWITSPKGRNNQTQLTADNAIYYFEVPCNPGEYALGSVSGSDGAYLIYLDIGTNGGDVIKTKVSGLGNGLTANFYVDDRVADYGENAENDVFVFDADGKIAEGSYSNNSLLQFSVEKMPEISENDNFEITLSFNKNSTDTNFYPNGLYTIDITNTATLQENLEIMIVLCDDDDPIEGNDFYPYAYNVIYNGNVVDNVFSFNPENDQAFKFFKSFVKIIIKPDGTYELSEEIRPQI